MYAIYITFTKKHLKAVDECDVALNMDYVDMYIGVVY